MGAAAIGEVEDIQVNLLGGAGTIAATITAPSAGSLQTSIESSAVVVQRGTQTLFRAPFAQFDFADDGSQGDDQLELQASSAIDVGTLVSLDGSAGIDTLKMLVQA